MPYYESQEISKKCACSLFIFPLFCTAIKAITVMLDVISAEIYVTKSQGILFTGGGNTIAWAAFKQL